MESSVNSYWILTNFSSNIWIFQFFGTYEQNANTMWKLCRATRQTWIKYRHVYQRVLLKTRWKFLCETKFTVEDKDFLLKNNHYSFLNLRINLFENDKSVVTFVQFLKEVPEPEQLKITKLDAEVHSWKCYKLLCDTLLELGLTDIFRLKMPHNISVRIPSIALGNDKKLHYFRTQQSIVEK